MSTTRRVSCRLDGDLLARLEKKCPGMNVTGQVEKAIKSFLTDKTSDKKGKTSDSFKPLSSLQGGRCERRFDVSLETPTADELAAINRARSEYMRSWRRRNPERVQAYQRRYWLRLTRGMPKDE